MKIFNVVKLDSYLIIKSLWLALHGSRLVGFGDCNQVLLKQACSVANTC